MTSETFMLILLVVSVAFCFWVWGYGCGIDSYSKTTSQNIYRDFNIVLEKYKKLEDVITKEDYK